MFKDLFSIKSSTKLIALINDDDLNNNWSIFVCLKCLKSNVVVCNWEKYRLTRRKRISQVYNRRNITLTTSESFVMLIVVVVDGSSVLNWTKKWNFF